MTISRIPLPTGSEAMRASALVWIGAFTMATAGAAPLTVGDTQVAASGKTGVRIASGTLELSRSGAWGIESPYTENGGVTELYLDWDVEHTDEFYEGERMAKLQDRRAIRERRMGLSRIYWRCSQFAREGDGLAPGTLAELEDEEVNQPAGGIHLVPKVRLYVGEGDDRESVEETELLLIDTTPAIDDGKHWTMDSHGVAKREEIDPEQVKALGLEIKPQRPPHTQDGRDAEDTAVYHIFGRLTGEPGVAKLTVRDYRTDQTREVLWDTRETSAGNDAICKKWAELRLERLDSLVRTDSPLALTWVQRIAGQYELGETYRDWRPDLFNANDNRTANAMGVLGGRAAIRETLQMRNLRVQAEDAESWNPTVPIGEIEGVAVEAHPFEKMLDGAPGGRLALADWIPHDRFMVYFQNPDGIFSLMDGGADFMAASGSMMTGRSLSHGLKNRYLESFGLSEALMKRFLKTGAIEEMAVSIPDLFLIDGAEMCVVMRTGRPLLTTAALTLVGIPPGDGMTVKKNRHGEEVYWERRGDILIVSTNHDELQAVLAAKEGGESLGASAELRYMLTQVPVTPETKVYAYFSDPFIRRLVGPEVKIGQLRRLMARREMEEASAGSRLASFDGQGVQAFDLAFLQEHGYMDPPFYAGDLALDEAGRSQSGFYGSAARLRSLSDLPVEMASKKEQEAYQQYLEGYNRYWRRYFDPIAIRYEQHAEGGHELETFILPLIENSLYGGLREFLPPAGQETPIRVPIIEPQPVAIMSCNLNEDAWLNAMEGFADTFEQVLRLDGAMLDLLGPDIHFAIQDADPIIALGSGEMQGLAGQFGRGGDMMAIPMIVSMLTRPCTLHIGLHDPERMRKLLSEMTWAPDHLGGDMSMGFGDGSLYQLAGQQKWIYRYSLEGIITLRFGIEVQDRYLVINNLPFSNVIKVTGNKATVGGAASLELNPAACVAQHPALFASAVEKLRINAVSGVAALTPMILSGTEDVEAARAAHAELFGFAPVHPVGGAWTWDAAKGQLISSQFGAMWSQQQPAFDPNQEDAGIFSTVSDLRLGMQFEDDGLRSTVRWKTR